MPLFSYKRACGGLADGGPRAPHRLAAHVDRMDFAECPGERPGDAARATTDFELPHPLRRFRPADVLHVRQYVVGNHANARGEEVLFRPVLLPGRDEMPGVLARPLVPGSLRSLCMLLRSLLKDIAAPAK